MSYRVCWQWTLAASPQQLWPYISDTDRFNALLGMSPVEFVDGGEVQAPFHLVRSALHGQTVVWEEPPFEWVAPLWFRVRRRFRRGPLAWLEMAVTLDPLPEGGTRLTYELRAEPANLMGRMALPLLFGRAHRRRVEQALRRLDEWACGRDPGRPDRLPLPTVTSVRSESLLAEQESRLCAQGFDAQLVRRLVEHVRSAPDDQVGRMHPLALARMWQTDPDETVRLFFHASRTGLLEIQWDLICPACHGTAHSVEHLEQLEERGRCEYCRIAYEVDFEHNVQVTFRPHPTIRPAEVPFYCIGGPRNTPHIMAQQWLQPGETKTIRLELPAGLYRLRWSTHPHWHEDRHAFGEWAERHPWQARLLVSQDGSSDQAEAVLGEALEPAELAVRAGAVTLRVTNSTAQEHLVSLERVGWSDDVLTAARVLTLHPFRLLFPFEALRKGLHIRVSSVTLLFTDLRGSTAFYRRAGDGPAFDRVSAHFDILRRHIEGAGGTIVKTIGDAVMAAFPSPHEGVRAVAGILRDIEAYNRDAADWPLLLRLGLNSGPALVVTLNGQLDYFGSTVNLAAKLERASRGNELVMLRSLADALGPALEEFVAEDDIVSIPGEEQPYPIVRLTLKRDERSQKPGENVQVLSH